MNYLLNKLMGVGVSPILTRQLCAAMFALSGHIFVAIYLALGLLQIQPGRSIPRKPPVVQIQLVSNKLPAATPATATAPATVTTPATETTPEPSAQSAAESTPATAAPPMQQTTQSSEIAGSGTSANLANPQSSVTPTPAAANQASSATASAAPVEILYYHSLKQLTEKPKVIEDAASGMNLILPGVETQNVILRLLINEQGQIDQVEIEHSTLMSNIEAIVTAAFAKLRFSPGKIDGVAVKCQLQIEVLLESADNPALQRLPVQ